jgi:hypothetical protein
MLNTRLSARVPQRDIRNCRDCRPTVRIPTRLRLQPGNAAEAWACPSVAARE